MTVIIQKLLGFNLEDVFTISSDLVQDFDDYIDSEVTITGRVFACDNQGLYLQDQSGSNIYVYCGSFGHTNDALYESDLATIIVEGQLNYDYSSYEDFEIIDAALINNGTVRATINSGEILKSEVYEVTPFDNVIVLCKIKGKYIKNIYGNNSGFLALALDDNYSSYEDLEDETVYNLAVIDYVFENRTYYSDFDYLSEDDYVVTSLFARNITYFAISEQYPNN